MAATATIQSRSSNPNVVLRAARLEAEKKRIGRTASGDRMGLSMRPAAPSSSQNEERFQSNPVARMRSRRHADQRYANPGASMPMLQEMSASLRNGNTGQEADADEIDQQAMQIADENADAQTLQLAARARSRTTSAGDDAAQKMIEQGMKKAEEIMKEIEKEVPTKAGSLEKGWFLLLINTTLTSTSIVRSIMGIFSENLKKYDPILTKVGLPVPKHLKLVGGWGTIIQVILYMAVVAVILFINMFQVLLFASISDALSGGNFSLLIKMIMAYL